MARAGFARIAGRPGRIGVELTIPNLIEPRLIQNPWEIPRLRLLLSFSFFAFQRLRSGPFEGQQP
jgi:hypothetical protein